MIENLNSELLLNISEILTLVAPTLNSPRFHSANIAFQNRIESNRMFAALVVITRTNILRISRSRIESHRMFAT